MQARPRLVQNFLGTSFLAHGSEVVVVDPPRKGLDASLLDALRIYHHWSARLNHHLRALIQRSKMRKDHGCYVH
uniref:Uncharacterized protein n=1 Tax=Salix viminalis TaxID=40686 RepID=A0A6N2KCL6_SALVM